MRIGWLSNAPHVPTGYGTSTAEVIWRLKAAGHEVWVAAFFGNQGAPYMANGIMILPCGAEHYGNDIIVADAEYFKWDILISNMDVWVLNKGEVRKVCWCPWFPVDHDPVPPAVQNALEAAHLPIVYSKWGQQMLRSAGIRAQYVPIPVNTQKFKPIDRMQARMRMGFRPDSFIVMINAANKGGFSRKSFDTQIRAFKVLHDRHPDAVLYLHTDMTGVYGEDLNTLLMLSGIPKEAITTPSPYKYSRGMISQEYLNDAYNSADVLSNAAMAEGFGIAIVEAQAAGCPVAVTNFSSMPELRGAGWLVDYATKIYTPQSSYQVIPDVDSIVDCYEKAYQARDNIGLRQQARAFALGYDSDRVVNEMWLPALDDIALDLGLEAVQKPAQAALQPSQVSTQPPAGLSRRQRRKWRQENGVAIGAQA